MTTLAEVADRAQNAIGDAAAGTWTQALVEEWIVEAIRDYSAHFARRVEDTISCTADTQEYNLPADFLGMLLVEYPAGEDPPEYLQFLPRHNPNFPSSDSYYDVLFTSDVGTVSIIRLSHDNVDGSDEIDITYLAQHDISLVSGDTITVPAHHEHLLILFVVWKALLELLTFEAQDPDTTIHLLQQMTNAATAAEDTYTETLATTRETHNTGSGWAGPWRVDDFDPIY